MKKNIIFLFLMCFSIVTLAQKAKSAKTVKTIQNKKNGYYEITKVSADDKVPNDQSKITFTFIGPDENPARKYIKIICNNDSVWPVVDAQGNYTAELDPGKYKLRFSVPFWHEVKTDSILLKKKSTTCIMIRFEAKDFRGN